MKDLKNDEIFFLKISKFMKNDCGRGSCPSSYPGGNQVDGLPLVAFEEQEIPLQEKSNTETVAKRARRDQRTAVNSTMKKLILKNVVY